MCKIVHITNPSQDTIETSPPPPTITGDLHKPSLLAIEPPHRYECFNRSGILRIHLKDLMENKLRILSFVVSLG